MESIFTLFLLFVAALTAIITYMVLPYAPVVTLIIAASLALAGGLWWHWTQFSVEYRLSTWQQNLRNYGSYVLVLMAILISYAFYVFVWVTNGGSFDSAIASARASISDGINRVSSKASRSFTAISSALTTDMPRDRTQPNLI